MYIYFINTYLTHFIKREIIKHMKEYLLKNKYCNPAIIFIENFKDF